jgi:hypothetical protein
LFNKIKAKSYNNDGSVTFQSYPLEGFEVNYKAEQVFDLSNRNIKDFVTNEFNTKGLADLIDPLKTFASGSKGYRSQPIFSKKVNFLSRDKNVDAQGKCTQGTNKGKLISELGDNCNAITLWNDKQLLEPALTEFSNLYSADLQPSNTEFKAVRFFGHYAVQIINDNAKTVRIYSRDQSDKLILSAAGSWSEINLPYLQQNATALKIIITSVIDSAPNILNVNYDFIIAKQAGFLRLGYILNAEFDLGYAGTDLNALANTSVINALTPMKPTITIVSPLVMKPTTIRKQKTAGSIFF